MTFRVAVALARRNLARDRRSAVSGAFGVAIGVAALVFFVALGTGVGEVVRTRVLPVDFASVEVVPPKIPLGGFLGGGTLNEAVVSRLESLPGVREALPKMSVRVSAVSRYNGDFFGRPLRLGIEVMAVGVDPRLFAGDVAPNREFVDPGPNEPLPAVVSTRLLELYNKSFAVQRELPTLTADLLTGFRFPVEFGRSYVAATGGRVQSGQFELVGFSDHALLGGITIPLDAARRINRDHGQDASTYSSVVLRAGSVQDVPAIVSEVRRMGFEIDDTEQVIAQQAGFAITVVTGTLALLSLLIGLLASVNIAHAFRAAVSERRREIGILRSVGATRRHVVTVLMLEAAFVGAAGGVVGTLVAVLTSIAADLAAGRLLPDFPFKPESFFTFPCWLKGVGFALGILAAVLGALGPARRAARMEPVEALAE